MQPALLTKAFNLDLPSTLSTDSECSRTSSRHSSIYIHNHCKNPKPLNVLGASIVYDQNDYLNQVLPETKDIALPHHNAPINELAIDIGGSLAKLIYFTKNENGLGGRLNFFKIETSKIDEFIKFIKTILLQHYDHNGDDLINSQLLILATGGGAVKFNDRLRKELKCNIQNEDEMQCLIIGLDFFITEIHKEIFSFDELNHKYVEIENFNFESEEEISHYPYLLVNIGSGVSMVKVTGPGPDNFIRVGGSSLGGGTLWGLLSILTDTNDFDEMLELASKGNNENVDLLVGDIYGNGYNNIGLKANSIASSMGKVFKKVLDNPEDRSNNDDTSISTSTTATSNTKKDERLSRLEKLNQEDIAKSLLYTVSNNIGQIAYLQAQRYNLKRIYFAGSYIRNHYQTIRTLSYAINFWSQGSKKAYFLKHEGYLGSMGAFLKREADTDTPFIDSSSSTTNTTPRSSPTPADSKD